MVETKYPFRISAYRIEQDTGAPGRWRGGNGAAREYELLSDCSVGLWFERSRTRPWGLFGGETGSGPDVVINPGRPDEEHLLKVNARPMKAGDVIRLTASGGGGYGRVADRDPQAVASDVANGYISHEYARRHYGYDS